MTIAKVLKEEIQSIDQARFDVVLDVESIELGTSWKAEIASAVSKSDLSIAIFTGDQKHVFDYCGYEVGLFGINSKLRKSRPMYCIYDTEEPPTILADLQGVPIIYESNIDPVLNNPEGWNPDTYSPKMKRVFQL